MGVVDRSFDHSLRLEECAVMPHAGGLLGNGYQCGMLWGGALAAGAQAYRLYGAGSQAETQAVMASQRLVDAFRVRATDINCAEITDIEWKATSKRRMATQVVKFVAKGGPIGCFRLAADYAPMAFAEINAAFAERHTQAPPQPVSCAAMLAQKMGASEMHVVMTAGLAGGIGLSGGACGVLGAAIWIDGLRNPAGLGNFDLNDPRLAGVIEKFLKSSDYEFECSKIVGRKFENVTDHAGYLREGGCSKIIEALAT